MSSAVSDLETVQPTVAQAENPIEQRRKAFATRMAQWLREPLFHFLLIGIGLFVAYSLITPSAARPNSRTIELTIDDLNQLQVSWMAQWQRPPTPDEMRGLIEERVRQEILYREAIALGLDQGDEIVKRRMAQKIEFLTEDVSVVRDPSPAELNSWFEKNAARFTLPGQLTFHHLYFSPDKRGQQAKADAARILGMLTGKQSDAATMRAGDRFMFQDYYADRSPDQIGNVFGTEFATSIFKLKPGTWQGPIESGLGWHLVLVDSLTPGRVPTFEEADQAAVKSEWLADQRSESKRKAFEIMKARYEVVLPKGPLAPITGGQNSPEVPRNVLANP